MKDVLVTASDRSRLETELVRHNGLVRFQLGEDLFVIDLPSSVHPGGLESARLVEGTALRDMAPHRAQLASAWLQAAEFRAIPTTERPDAGLSWDAAGFQAPGQLGATAAEDLELGAGFLRPRPSAPSYAPTSEYMVGKVVVGLVIVSGPGDLNLSGGEIQKIEAQVLTGLSFFQSANPGARLTFALDTHVVPVTVRPPDTCSSYESCEAPWRDAALAEMGYQPSLEGSRDYVASIIRTYGARWGYVGYFTKYPLKWFAYQTGERVVMQYANDNWGPDNIHSVFAHETGHAFGAKDEYSSSDCNCGGQYGYFGAGNCNCASCPGDRLKCLMDGNNLALCTWSRRQIGWGAWSPQTNITDINGAKTSASPALAAFGNRLYLVYRGADSSNIWSCSFDGSTWSAQTNITDINGAKTSASPALAAFGNRLYLVYRGADSSNIWSCSFDGSTWSAQTNITDINGAKTSASPVVAALATTLVVVFRGDDSDNIWTCTFDGSVWLGQTRLTDQNGALTSAAPAAAPFGEGLQLTYKGASSSNLWSCYYAIDAPLKDQRAALWSC